MKLLKSLVGLRTKGQIILDGNGRIMQELTTEQIMMLQVHYLRELNLEQTGQKYVFNKNYLEIINLIQIIMLKASLKMAKPL